MNSIDINTRITLGCDLIVVLGADAYEDICRKHGVRRLLDAPADIEQNLWLEHCFLTKERAQKIVNKISQFNFNNLSKQIKASYSVYSSYVTLTINGIEYGHADFVSAVTALRYLGLRIDFNELGKGV